MEGVATDTVARGGGSFSAALGVRAPGVRALGQLQSQLQSDSPLFRGPSETDAETDAAFATHVLKLQRRSLHKPDERRYLLATHSSCCGFGNTLGALEGSFVLALLTNCTWVTTSHYMNHFDHPVGEGGATTNWNVGGEIPPSWWRHELARTRRVNLGFRSETAFRKDPFGRTNKSLAIEQLRKKYGHTTFTIRDDRVAGVEGFIKWLVSVDPYARHKTQITHPPQMPHPFPLSIDS